MEKEKNIDKNLKEPSGMKRDEVAKTIAEIFNDSYGPTIKLVKRECNESSSHINGGKGKTNSQIFKRDC